MAMFFVTTRSVFASIALTVAYFAMVQVLLNENSDFNIFSRSWLEQNGFSRKTGGTIESYKNNIENLLYA
jgi:hypothetical protein